MTARPTPGAGDIWGANLNAWLDETFATKAAAAHVTDTAAHPNTFVRFVTDLALDGTDAAGNTTKLNAAIAAAPAGSRLLLRAGDIAFTTLTQGAKTVELAGEGWATAAGDLFGSATYNSPLTAPTWEGTILHSTATTGTAIPCHASKPFNLRNLAVVGPGSGTSVGIDTGTTSARYRWDNVYVANFHTCVIWRAQDSKVDQLCIMGAGSRGLRFVGNPNQNEFDNTVISQCAGRAISAEGGTLVSFNGGVLQANTGTVFYAEAAHAFHFSDVYWENSGATRAVDTVTSGDYHRFDTCHFGTAGDGIRFGTHNNVILFPQAVGVVEDNGTDNSFIGIFPTAITGTGTGGIRMSLSSAEYNFGNRNLRIGSGKKIFLETTGSSNFIGRDTGTGDTHIGSATPLAQLAGDGAPLVVGHSIYGSPEGSYAAPVGALFTTSNGGVGRLYLKTSGTGNTGWTQIT